MTSFRSFACASVCLLTACLAPASGAGQNEVLTGQAAFTDYRTQKPGIRHKIAVADLPKPFSTESAGNGPTLVPRPKDAWPVAPAGFHVDLYASGLDGPRLIRTAPNGDLFVAETHAGEIKVFRGVTKDGKPAQTSVYATGLQQPFGIALFSSWPEPAMAVHRQHQFRRPLCLQQRRPQGLGPGPDPRPGTRLQGRTLHPRRCLLTGRQAHVRLGRLALERR